jgi:plasmid stability protein
MTDILVRGLDAESIKQLKSRAKRHGRSLQGEAKMVLEQAAGAGTDEIQVVLNRWKKRFVGRSFSSSARLIREDRRR